MPISRSTFSANGRIRPFSAEFAQAMRQIAESCASWDEARSAIMAKVMEPGEPRSGVSTSSSEFTWAVINATYSGSFVTGVAPTDLGNGIFEYRAVPVRITGYSAGVFTYDIHDDPRFSPDAYEGSSVMLLNAPTHENTADWKYAGVSTGSGSSYPAGFDVMGIGQDHVTGEWKSPLILIQKLSVDQDTTLWMLAAEPDHDGSCTPSETSDAAPGDTSASYLTVSAEAGLSAERVATAGNHITITDAGAGSTVTFDWKPNPLKMARFWTEGSTAGDFATLSAGTSAGTTANSANSDSTHPGTMSSSTGTTSTGRSAGCYIDAAAIQFGTYAWRAVGCFMIPTLSDGTQTFSVMIGFNDSFTSTTYTDCACFRYQHSANSGKFECLTRSNSTGSPTDSGVTATAGTWYSYEIRVNAAATSVEFYLNGTLVQTHTTDIPSGSSRVVGFGHNIVKSAGLTARTLITDCCLVEGAITR